MEEDTGGWGKEKRNKGIAWGLCFAYLHLPKAQNSLVAWPKTDGKISKGIWMLELRGFQGVLSGQGQTEPISWSAQRLPCTSVSTCGSPALCRVCPLPDWGSGGAPLSSWADVPCYPWGSWAAQQCKQCATATGRCVRNHHRPVLFFTCKSCRRKRLFVSSTKQNSYQTIFAWGGQGQIAFILWFLMLGDHWFP